MRFTLVTFGSEGDTRPLAALARGLMDAGHEVCLFAEGATLARVRDLGVPCEALQGDVRSMLPIVDPTTKLKLADVLKVSKGLQNIIAQNMSAWIRTVAAHARQSDAILFSSLAFGAGIAVAAELRKPLIGLWFQPVTPTRAFNSPLMQPRNLPGWANLLTYRLLHRYMWAPYAKPTALARKEIFGTTSSARPAFDFPMLYGISSQLVSEPADWPKSHRICGHWSMPADTFSPPDELATFLADGPPPMYAGFGTASCFIRRKALTALIDAVAGRRVLFAPGWSKIDNTVLPANFHLVGNVPHEWLFPRMSLVIHHGGAGTTHTAARAGVPQIVLPVGGDQPFWASRAAAAGIAPGAKPNARLKASEVARMIDSAHQPGMRERARAVAAAMAREDGVGTTVKAIEQTTREARA